jgi:hypothetical protein
VSRSKLQSELDAWRRNEADHRRRGLVLLRADLDALVVEVAFLTLIPMGATQIPIVMPAIRLNYENYDLWPPALTFIDIFSGQACKAPLEEALMPGPDGQARNVLMTNTSGKQFLCLRGTREYHEHPDHNGDLWTLYREERRGAIAVICERVLETMTGQVAGVAMQLQPGLLMPSRELPLAQAQELARQARARYDAQITAQAAQLGAVDIESPESQSGGAE